VERGEKCVGYRISVGKSEGKTSIDARIILKGILT
jgi:hypothetical protein